MFTDEFAILTKKTSNTKVIIKELEKANIKINIVKTKSMISPYNKNHEIEIIDRQIVQRESFKDLGSVFELAGKFEKEMEERIWTIYKSFDIMKTGRKYWPSNEITYTSET